MIECDEFINLFYEVPETFVTNERWTTISDYDWRHFEGVPWALCLIFKANAWLSSHNSLFKKWPVFFNDVKIIMRQLLTLSATDFPFSAKIIHFKGEGNEKKLKTQQEHSTYIYIFPLPLAAAPIENCLQTFLPAHFFSFCLSVAGRSCVLNSKSWLPNTAPSGSWQRQPARGSWQSCRLPSENNRITFNRIISNWKIL